MVVRKHAGRPPFDSLWQGISHLILDLTLEKDVVASARDMKACCAGVEASAYKKLLVWYLGAIRGVSEIL